MWNLRLGRIAVLATGAWLGLGAALVDGRPALAPGAAAQGSVTPPAGQARGTAPGGLRGRTLRRTHAPRGRRR